MKRTAMKIALAAAFALCTPVPGAIAQDAAAPTQPSEPVKLALAREIIAAGFPEEKREGLFFASMDQMMIQTREATLRTYALEDDGAIAVLDEWIGDYVADSKEVLRSHIPALMEGMAASYANMFTRDELDDILAFVATPSGQRFFELSPAILAEPNFAAANQAYMNEVQQGMPAAMQDLVSRLQKYLSEQQATAEHTKS